MSYRRPNRTTGFDPEGTLSRMALPLGFAGRLRLSRDPIGRGFAPGPGQLCFSGGHQRRGRDTIGAPRIKSLAAASSSIHRPMASYETGIQEFGALPQSAEATGRSSLPLKLTPARTRVQRSDANAPSPKASTTACCSAAPRPILPGILEKKRMAQLAGFPGREASSVLIIMRRSTPAASIDASTVAAFLESRAERSKLADVTPRAVSTASAAENACVRAS